MKTQPFLISFCSLLIALPAMADVFVLKDGSRLEGTILREEGEKYVLEVKVTKSIRDEKTVAKSDVVTIEKEQKDLSSFDTLKGLLPTPDLLGSDEYATRIALVENFLKTYPASTKKADAAKILETLKAEANAVAEGGMKINGAILPASEYKANAYDIDAEKQAAVVRSAGARYEYVNALRAFTVLEKNFKESKAYKSTLPVVNQILAAYEAQVKTALATLPAREKEQKDGLARMSGQDRINAESALASQKVEAQARYTQEKADKELWVTADPFLKQTLEDTSRAITSTRSRLSSYKPSETAADPGAAYRAAWKAVQSRDAKASSDAVRDARTARVPARYADPLAEEVKVIQAEAKAKAEEAKAAALAAAKAEKEAADAEEAAKAAEDAKKAPQK